MIKIVGWRWDHLNNKTLACWWWSEPINCAFRFRVAQNPATNSDTLGYTVKTLVFHIYWQMIANHTRWNAHELGIAVGWAGSFNGRNMRTPHTWSSRHNSAIWRLTAAHTNTPAHTHTWIECGAAAFWTRSHTHAHHYGRPSADQHNQRFASCVGCVALNKRAFVCCCKRYKKPIPH